MNPTMGLALTIAVSGALCAACEHAGNAATRAALDTYRVVLRGVLAPYAADRIGLGPHVPEEPPR